MTMIVDHRPAFAVATHLIDYASELSGISPFEIARSNAKRRHFKLRFAIIWALYQLNPARGRSALRPYSYPRLAKLLGFDDHNSVIYGHRKAIQLRQEDPAFKDLADKLLIAAMDFGPQVAITQAQAA